MKQIAKMALKMIIISVSIFLILYMIYYKFIYNFDNLPKGVYVESVISPNKKYRLNSYLYSGGATLDWALRVEIENIKTNEKHNVYWKYHEKESDIKWIDNNYVKINGMKLNVFKDKYDFRFN